MFPLSITAAGMVTAVGFNAPASCAAIRAGISGVKEANLWDAESGEYLTAGKVHLPQWWEGLGKLADLVSPAIFECLIAARPVPPEQVPILLGVPTSDRPSRFMRLDDQLLDEVEYRLGLPRHPASQIIPRGHVAGVVAIREASRLIGERRVPCCIVAGVDSFLQQELVEIYMQRRRILTPNNSNGFIPGEAGTAVLITKAGSFPEGELYILGISLTQEPATIDSEEPLRGDGLTAAIDTALTDANLTMANISYRITDLNGEHYKFKEAIFPVARLLKSRIEPGIDMWHPIEYLGEIGAAIAPCTFAIALDAGRKGYAPGDFVLCHFSSDNGERAALVARFERPDKG